MLVLENRMVLYQIISYLQTTISTVDADTAVGHLTLQPDGDLVLDPASQKTIINATDGLYFDGGTHTYITESGDDTLDFYVGPVKHQKIKDCGEDESDENDEESNDDDSEEESGHEKNLNLHLNRGFHYF